MSAKKAAKKSGKKSVAPLDDILGPSPKKAVKPKAKKKQAPKVKEYNRLKAKGKPPEKGLIALKKEHGGKLGVTCLICHDKLAYKSGRRPILCRKRACFKKMRCAYRYDWEALSPAFKEAA